MLTGACQPMASTPTQRCQYIYFFFHTKQQQNNNLQARSTATRTPARARCCSAARTTSTARGASANSSTGMSADCWPLAAGAWPHLGRSVKPPRHPQTPSFTGPPTWPRTHVRTHCALARGLHADPPGHARFAARAFAPAGTIHSTSRSGCSGTG